MVDETMTWAWRLVGVVLVVLTLILLAGLCGMVWAAVIYEFRKLYPKKKDW